MDIKDPQWVMVIVTIVYVVATIAMCVITFFSVKVASATLKLQQQNNYDSVKPALSVYYASVDSPVSYKGSIKLINHGLGPAIITGLSFQKGKKIYKNRNGYCTFFHLINERLLEVGAQLPVREVFYSIYTKEFRNSEHDKDYLAVGESLLLLEFEAIGKEQAEIVGGIFNNVTMELAYTDIYDNEEKVIKRLSYFKPNWLES